MTLKQFIKDNKEAIDAAIKRATGNPPQNAEDRRLWILNDEGLYRWARSEGCKI